MPSHDLVALLLDARAQRKPCSDAAGWLPAWSAAQSSFASAGPFTAAVAGALHADRVAWAFFCGYQGALQAGFALEPGRVGAFCANETQRKLTEIETTVEARGDQLVLSGRKSWMLAGFDDPTLFVLARNANGPAKGPGSLAVVRLPLRSAGITCEPARTQSVIPELPHAPIRIDAASLPPSALMRGDGYADYAKPFRLLEDVFVTGCVLAYLLAESHEGRWPTPWCQRAIAALVLLEGCARRDPREVDTILLVAGALAFAGDVTRDAETHWQTSQGPAWQRWLRDKPLLAGGKDARRQRAIQSWHARGRQADDEPA